MNTLRSFFSFHPMKHQFISFHNQALPPKTIAARLFSKTTQSSTLHYPLHEAIKQGRVGKVQKILRTEIVSVNGVNEEGELPLGIAVKEYGNQKHDQKKNAYNKIITLLYDYGACYLYEGPDGKATAPLTHTDSLREEGFERMELLVDCIRHSIDGCGIPLEGCTNGCKEENQEYSPEFKAKIALESLSTSLSVEKLAEKHRIDKRKIIKWRWQAREGLVKLFKDVK